MHKHFYLRLARTNLHKNRKFYFPYILSCTLAVILHVILCSLSGSDAWMDIPGYQALYSILGLGVWVMELFTLVLLLYTNSFLIKRRAREFGLYNVLGMEKHHICRVLFWESTLAYLISLALGVLMGILFSKLAELLLCNIVGLPIRYQMELSPSAMLRTLAAFAIYWMLTLLSSFRLLRRSNPTELLHSTSTGDREPKANWLLALLGATLLGTAYWLAVSIDDPVAALGWFFVAVIMVIAGTYCCFIAASVVALKLLRHWKRYYYQTRHFISVGSMLHRMKRNGAGLATICILSTMVLVTISTTACLFIGKNDVLHQRYPRQINLQCDVAGYDLEDISQEPLQRFGLTASNQVSYRNLSFSGLLAQDAVNLDYESAQQLDLSTAMNFLVVPLEDYNQNVSQPVTLSPDEALVYATRQPYTLDQLTLGGKTYRVQHLDSFLSNGTAASTIFNTVCVVLPDLPSVTALLSQVQSAHPDTSVTLESIYCFDTDGDEATQRSLAGLLSEQTWDTPVNVDARATEAQDFLSIFGSLFFLGIFLGLTFLLATVLIIYYKQITEGYEDQSRFLTLRQVGMQQREIRRTIHSQVLTVFFLPLAAAGMHTAFAFPLISKLLMLFNLFNQPLLIGVTLGVFLLFGVVYGGVYLLTSRFYYQIVSTSDR